MIVSLSVVVVLCVVLSFKCSCEFLTMIYIT